MSDEQDQEESEEQRPVWASWVLTLLGGALGGAIVGLIFRFFG